MESKHSRNHVWPGIVLVIVGIAFLLDNLDVFYFPRYLFGWEMLMILIGGAMLISRRKEGIVFLAIGALFLLPDIFYIPRFYIRDWWPIILVAIGISIILKKRRQHTIINESGYDYINEVTILGGIKRNINSSQFKGGKITAIFGGSEIDFAKAVPSQKETIIDIFVMFGGTTLFIPPDWTLKVEAVNILGGFSDSRRSVTLNQGDPEKVMIIRGFIMFGGGEIKSA